MPIDCTDDHVLAFVRYQIILADAAQCSALSVHCPVAFSGGDCEESSIHEQIFPTRTPLIHHRCAGYI